MRERATRPGITGVTLGGHVSELRSALSPLLAQQVREIVLWCTLHIPTNKEIQSWQLV